MHDQDQESAKHSVFDRMGGETAIRALVDRFYDLMELESGFTALRSTHGPDLSSAREKLFWFLCGWMGGPQHYVERFGHPRLRARHMPFKIGVQERDQWLACMAQAMHDTQVDPDLAAQLQQAFFQTADWMRNQDA